MASVDVQEVSWSIAGERCLAIRRRVFIEEQGVAEGLEIDGQDAACRHVLASSGDDDIATGRLLPDGKIGRVAVLSAWRGQGLGHMVMDALEAIAQEAGFQNVRLAAQEAVVGFYKARGYGVVSERFIEADIPHRWMEKQFVLPQEPQSANA